MEGKTTINKCREWYWVVKIAMTKNIFFNKFIYLGCIESLLLHADFLWLRWAGATLCCGAQASHCGGFSCCRAWALGTRTSVAVACWLSSCGLQALECSLSSCGTWAYLLRSMWDLPGPGLKPVSPALASRFLTTVPSGKPWLKTFWRRRKGRLILVNSKN